LNQRFEREIFAAALKWCQRSCGRRGDAPIPPCWQVYRPKGWLGLLPVGPECDELAEMMAFLLEKLPQRLASHLRYVATEPPRSRLYGGLREAVTTVLMNRQFFTDYVRHVRGRVKLPVALRVPPEVEGKREMVVTRTQQGETIKEVAEDLDLKEEEVEQLLIGEVFKLLRRGNEEEAITEKLGGSRTLVRTLGENLEKTLKQAGVYWDLLGPLLVQEKPRHGGGESEDIPEQKMVSEEAGPAAIHQARLVRKMIQDGLAQLPPLERETLRQGARGLTAKEIADVLRILDLNPNAPPIQPRRVYTILSRAISQLNRYLEETLETQVEEKLLQEYLDFFGEQLFEQVPVNREEGSV